MPCMGGDDDDAHPLSINAQARAKPVSVPASSKVPEIGFQWFVIGQTVGKHHNPARDSNTRTFFPSEAEALAYASTFVTDKGWSQVYVAKVTSIVKRRRDYEVERLS